MADTGCRVITRLMDTAPPLPLAAARNAGAAEAIAAGADHLIFLDVDCVPTPGLIDSYVRSLTVADRPALHCGVVRYLGPEIDVDELTSGRLLGTPHPARPHPEPGDLAVRQPSDDWALFWSLSFALSHLRPGSGSAASTRTTSDTERRTPTSVSWPIIWGSTSSGPAGPTRTISTTPRRRYRSSISTTSCATPGSFTGGGVSGRCRAG